MDQPNQTSRKNQRSLNGSMTIYFDNAATSFPKPESVYKAVDQFARYVGVGVGRGNFRRAVDVLRMVEQTRNKLAKLIGAPNKNNVSFCFSGTDALSTAIFGFLRPGDHVVTSVVDHTSVLRPLDNLIDEIGISVSYVGCDEAGCVSAGDIAELISEKTKLVCITHASNVTGTIQPVEAIGAVCKTRDVKLLVDSAQTIGHISIDVATMGCDFLCAPGHKGLLGPLGTGILYVADRVADETKPFRFGGTGSSLVDEGQPATCPAKFESGNLNVNGIAGLAAALDWLQTEEAETRKETSAKQIENLLIGLGSIAQVRFLGPASSQHRLPVISFSIEQLDCQTAGMLLDSQFEIECRTGLHCAPRLHQALGTSDAGGLIRFSPGLFTTDDEIQKAVDAVQTIVDTV